MAFTSFNAALAVLVWATFAGLVLVEVGVRIERRANQRNRKDG